MPHIIASEPSVTDPSRVSRARTIFDARAMMRNPVAVLESYRARFGPTFAFHFAGIRRAIATSDPVVIEHVLRTNQDNYHKSHIQLERMVEFQGRGLVNIHGEEWLRQRRVVVQGFKPNHLAKLLPLEQDVLRELMSGFDKEVRLGPVEIHHQMSRFTLRLVGRALFGRSMADAELEQIGYAIAEIEKFATRQIIQPYKIPWFRLSGETERHQRLRRGGDAIVLRHVRARLQQGIGDTDIVRILLETPYRDTGEPMGVELAMIESLQQMVAGNSTSSAALTWVFYLLARHPQYIGGIRDEFESVIGDAAINYHNLHQLELTMSVISEALRLYPPFWMIDRVALRDDDAAGVHIPAGTMLIPYIYGTHRNPEHWDDVETFDPRRFEPAKSKVRHPFAFIPFGGGPRMCVGRNMALMQMLLIVATVARKYDFVLSRDVPVGIHPMMLTQPAGPVVLKFESRA